MLIYDADDLTDQDGWFLDKLKELKAINPLFKATVFAIPGKCNTVFLQSIPSWIELAVHGNTHDSNFECLHWDYKDMIDAIDGDTNNGEAVIRRMSFAKVFKAPGWQISGVAREALRDHGWILADNPLYKQNRLEGERIYDFTEWGNKAWHGHVQNVCGNGLLELWDKLVDRIKDEDDFRFISEMVP